MKIFRWANVKSPVGGVERRRLPTKASSTYICPRTNCPLSKGDRPSPSPTRWNNSRSTFSGSRRNFQGAARRLAGDGLPARRVGSTAKDPLRAGPHLRARSRTRVNRPRRAPRRSGTRITPTRGRSSYPAIEWSPPMDSAATGGGDDVKRYLLDSRRRALRLIRRISPRSNQRAFDA